MLNIFLSLLSIWVFSKSFSYSIYEIKENNNKAGGITCCILSLIGLVLPNIALWML